MIKNLNSIKNNINVSYYSTPNHIDQQNLQVVFGFNDSLFNSTTKIIHDIDLIGSIVDLKNIGANLIINNHKKILLISLGQKDQFNYQKFLSALKAIGDFILHKSITPTIDIHLDDEIANILVLDKKYFCEQSLFYLLNFMYSFDELKSKPKAHTLTQINLINDNLDKTLIDNTLHLIEGLFLIKHLANNPANIATPTYLAQNALKFTDYSDKVKCTIMDLEEIKTHKMNAFLAVTSGSEQAPKFIVLEYYGASEQNEQPIVLVGKGITFDSGGISIKPASNMDKMKFDMCGAATVLGTFLTTIKLQLKINLVVVVPTCENLPSGTAIKPGDVVTTMSGKTVEINNTDAEGRLILADALTYVKRFNPKYVLDFATLTGACVVALGNVASGVFCNDDTLFDTLAQSSEISLDKIWRLPLFEEYQECMKGKTGDLSNISSSPTKGGLAASAAFLHNFIDYKWAHFDIAGVADGDSIYNSANYSEATGRPYYLLIDFIRNQACKHDK